MSNVIKLKHSILTATPAALAQAEPAYSENSQTLFIGTSTGQVIPIGGKKFTDKVNGIEAGAQVNLTGAEMVVEIGKESNVNFLTDAEVAKLAGLESSKFKGTFTTLAALETGVPSPKAGDYADVDGGVDHEVVRYIWDATDDLWAAQAGVSNAETAASIKAKYESNPNTNAFTDALLAKLNGIEAGATGDMTGAEIVAAIGTVDNVNLISDAEKAKLGGIEAGAQVNLSATEMKAAIDALSNTNFMTDAEQTKLGSIEANATADQTGEEIVALIAGEANVNLVNDAQLEKVQELVEGNGIIDGGSF